MVSLFVVHLLIINLKKRLMAKTKLTFKTWRHMNAILRRDARKKLAPGQNPKDCKFGYDENGTLQQVLDYGVLKNIFYI